MLWSKSFLGLNFIFLCFGVMITCDYSEFKTIAKKILTKDKTEPLKLLKRYSSIKVKTYVVHNMLNLLRWPEAIYMRVGYLSVFGFRNN